MEIKIHNTASGQKETFKPINPKRIGMYLCGPTVYDEIHIGNARPLVIFDVFYRLLRYNYGENVTYVRNITDVDDKINMSALKQNVPIKNITENNIEHFHESTESLNCLEPTHEPLATEHIEEMIEIIEILLQKGHAYIDDEKGHVFFKVSSMREYGKFAGISQEDLIASDRSSYSDPTSLEDIVSNKKTPRDPSSMMYYGRFKESPNDFVLWKPSPDGIPGWDNPWNEKGRPGWHIECSAMSRKYLGESFDLHMGGQDLIFPHHQNEIAQSCCAFPDSSFARYWMHNGYVLIEGKKMSKSLGNFHTVCEITRNYEKYQGAMLRLLLLQTHYRSPLDFYQTRLYEAEAILDKFYNLVERYQDLSDENDNYHESNVMPIFEALCDDLNTPLALHHWHEAMNKLKGSGKKEDYLAVLTGAAILGIPKIRPKSSWHDFEKKGIMSLLAASKDNRSKEETERDFARKYIKATKQKDLELLDEAYEDSKKYNKKYDDNVDIINYPIDKLEKALREAGVGIDDSDSEEAIAQKTVKDKVNNEIEAMIAERKEAKDKKDFDKADKIRDKLKAMGVELEDTPTGTVWRIKGH